MSKKAYAEQRQRHKKEVKILEAIDAANWFADMGRKKLRRLRGEFPKMTAADLGIRERAG